VILSALTTQNFHVKKKVVCGRINGLTKIVRRVRPFLEKVHAKMVVFGVKPGKRAHLVMILKRNFHAAVTVVFGAIMHACRAIPFTKEVNVLIQSVHGQIRSEGVLNVENLEVWMHAQEQGVSGQHRQRHAQQMLNHIMQKTHV